MPKTPQSRLFFALIVAVLVSIIGRNLYRRHLTSVLNHAVEAKDVAQVRSLLDSGVDANTKEPDENPRYPGSSLLYMVIDPFTTGSPIGSVQMSPQQEIACLLIQHGADLRDDSTGHSGYLQDACNSGSLPVVRCLLEHGANVNYTGNSSAALQKAVDYGLYAGNMSGSRYSPSADQKVRCLKISRDMVDALRQHGARLTALAAVQLEDAGLLREALASGANVNEQRQGEKTALYAAAQQGNLAMTQTLLAHGADPNLASANFESALGVAAAAGYHESKANPAIVELLLAHGAKINSIGINFDSPLINAIVYKHPDIARLLLAHNADPNLERTVNNYRGSPLAAAAANLPALVPDLLAHHADINSADGGPLKAAIQSHNADLVRYLLRHGAKIYPAITKSVLQTYSAGQLGVQHAKPQLTFIATPSTLQTAVTYDPPCFEILMQAGATLGNDKAGILLAAASAGRAALFDRLIALGANVNAATGAGSTPLTEALKYAPAGVPTLLEHGANPDVVTNGQTPLIIVVQTGNTNLTRLLLAHGAGVNARPPRGHTPLYYARRHNNADILKLLEQAGAKVE